MKKVPNLVAMKFTLFLSLFFATHSFGNTYYISNSGSNSNNGLSESEAFMTIQHASDIVTAGDSVLVLAGNYVGFDHRGASGTVGNPIVFMAIRSVIIDSSGPIRNDGINVEGADYIVIDGFTSKNMPGNGNGIRIVLSDHVLVKNNRCDNNAERGIFTAFTDDITIEYNICTNSLDEHGIYVSNSSDRPIIRYNECYGNNNIGIHMNGDLSAGGDGIISDAQVYGNIIHDNNRAAGINMDGCLNPRVFNNLIYNNHNAQGIALFQEDGAFATRGAEIYNNTIIVPSDGRWGILVNVGSHIGTQIYNNIIINNHSTRGCVTTESVADGFMCDYNMVNDKMSASGDGSTISLAQWQALTQGANSILSPPLDDVFKEPFAITPDFQLKPNASAIDAGKQLVFPLKDLIGISRPQNNDFDIGAYEKIYCPATRTLSTILPNAMYYAQDLIILSGAMNIDESLELIAPTIDCRAMIEISSGAILKIQTMGCDPSQ